MIAWYGLKPADGVRLVQGVTQNASGQYVVNPRPSSLAAPLQNGSNWERCIPNANLSNLNSNTGGVTVAQEIFDLVDTLNDEKEQQEKRWAFARTRSACSPAYDFRREP
jgi:hypothetical protein